MVASDPTFVTQQLVFLDEFSEFFFIFFLCIVLD